MLQVDVGQIIGYEFGCVVFLSVRIYCGYYCDCGVGYDGCFGIEYVVMFDQVDIWCGFDLFGY